MCCVLPAAYGAGGKPTRVGTEGGRCVPEGTSAWAVRGNRSVGPLSRWHRLLQGALERRRAFLLMRGNFKVVLWKFLGTSSGFLLESGIESQNHRMVGVGRDLWGVI